MLKTKNNKRYQQAGFTLVEVIAVIVILGALAVAAVPRFINIQSDARIAQLQGMLGVIRSATQLAVVKGQVEGVSDGPMEFRGNTIQMAGGYPTAQWNATFYALIYDSGRFDTGGTGICPEDWCTRGNVGSLGIVGATTPRNMQVWPRGFRRTDNCYAWYHNGNSGGDGLVASGLVSSGC